MIKTFKNNYKLIFIIVLSLSPVLYIFSKEPYSSVVLANCIGFVAAILLWWQIPTGIRHVIKLFTDDQLIIRKLHIWLGTYGTIFVFLHPILEIIPYAKNLIWLFLPNNFDINSFDFYISFGRLSFLLILIIWISSAILRSKVKFRPWLYLHFLSYPAAILAMLHALNVGTFIQAYPLLKIYFMLLLVTFVIFSIFRLLNFTKYLLPKYKVNK